MCTLLVTFIREKCTGEFRPCVRSVKFAIRSTCTLKIWKFSHGFYFRETSRMRSIVKLKPSRNGEITMSFTVDVGKSCPKSRFFSVANMSFNAIRENKNLAKISEFAFFQLVIDQAPFVDIVSPINLF